MLLYARVLVFLVCVKKDEIKITCPKDIGKNKPKAKLTCFLSKKSIFWRQKIALEKGVRYEKTKKWVKLEVGEELLKYLGKKYDLPISMVVSTSCNAHYERRDYLFPLMVRSKPLCQF